MSCLTSATQYTCPSLGEPDLPWRARRSWGQFSYWTCCSRRGRGDGQGGSSCIPWKTCTVLCVYLCEFLWSEYCRAVITAVQFANNQQMWTAISLWVMTFDGRIDFPRDAEILWQLNLTTSLHVLSGQHLSGFVVRVALVAVTVFSSGHERDSGPQQQFFRYFSSWKYAHLWAWHFLLSSF